MRCIAAILLCLSVSVSVYANRYSSSDDLALSAAKSVVARYKELRKYCSVTQGQERKECFSELNSANADYQEAKHTISSHRQQRSSTNLHIVSHVE